MHLHLRHLEIVCDDVFVHLVHRCAVSQTFDHVVVRVNEHAIDVAHVDCSAVNYLQRACLVLALDFDAPHDVYLYRNWHVEMVTSILNDSVGHEQSFVVNVAAVVIWRVCDFDSVVNGLDDRQVNVISDDIPDSGWVILTSVEATEIAEMDFVLGIVVMAFPAVA